MPAIVLLGAQWGDEGKGKATDLLGSRVDYVVKFNGGNNAGHTVVIGDEKYALHLLPSGILTPGVVPVIGNGVVIDLGVLFHEIDGLDARGVDTSRLVVSANAHVIPSYNRTLDKVTERFLGSRKIGTTGRGIGPAYEDKIARRAIRISDLFSPKDLEQKLGRLLDLHNFLLSRYYRAEMVDPRRELDFCGVYRISTDGTLTLLTKELGRPNGIGFSPDEKTVYVAQSDPEKAIWMAFDVQPDGKLGKGRQFYDATAWVKAGKKGLPDGLKVDADGNLFATAPGGVAIFAADGTHLGTIETGEATANCAWGEDGSVLYITADMYLCRVRTTTKGARF